MAIGTMQHPETRPLPPDPSSAPIALVEDAIPLLQVAAAPSHVLWVVELVPTEHVAYVSPSFERMWGRPVHALYADYREWIRGVHPDDRTRVRAAFEHWLADPTRRRYDVEFRVVRPDGREHWIHDTGHAVFSPQGELQRLTGIAEDITERRQLEDTLRDRQRYFRNMAETLSQLVWATRPDGYTEYLSPQWVQYTGVPAEDQLGDGWLMQIHPDDRPAVARAWQAAVRTGTPYAVEMRIRRHDGADRWFMARGCPLRTGNGEIRHWFGTSTDIDDLKRANDELARQRDRVAIIAATSPSVVHSLHLHRDGRYTVPFGARRMADLYGVRVDLLETDCREAMADRIHPDGVLGMSESIADSATRLTPWRREFRVRHPQHGDVWVEAHSMPVREPDGSTVWHGTLTDVTERHRSEARVLALNAELESRVEARTSELQAAVRDLEAFSYSVSHDLRAPLRAIDGFSKVVTQEFGGQLPEAGRRYLNIIRDSAQKMGQLIDDLLAFARLGRQALTRHPVDTALLVREALTTLTPMQQGRDIDIRVGALPRSDCDPAMLRQVWINLLSNALKYTRQCPSPRVEVGFDGTEFYVRDNGAGFDMKYAHKLFHVFERLHRAEEFEGTGVGLAIVQRIVERHGGAIRAESVPGVGTTFSFHLGVAETVS